MKEKEFVFPKNLYRSSPKKDKNRISVEDTIVQTPVQLIENVTNNNAVQVDKRPFSDDTNPENEENDIDFCENVGSTHMIYWQDCLAHTMRDIQKQQKTCVSTDFDFFKPTVMQYLFTVCIRLRLPNHVRFTAALIFNTFMIRQVSSLYKFLQDQEDLDHSQKIKEWENIETNVERQIPLRLLTAIQISSKQHSYHDSLSSRQVVNCLRSLSFPYPIDAVLKSELRMFKMIEFKIPESPLIICEMVMKVFCYTMQKRGWLENDQYDTIWQHILVILDICFLHHSVIYEKFVSRKPIIEPPTKCEEIAMARLKCDFLLLSSAVIQSSIHCVISQEQSEVASEVIGKISNSNLENSRKLYESIIQLLDEENSC